MIFIVVSMKAGGNVRIITTEPSTLGQQFFGSVTKILNCNYTKCKIFRLCLFCEKLRLIQFAQRTSVKTNKS